jgi:hypothetical protein
MIAHQDIGMDAPARLLTGFTQSPQQPSPISVIAKNHLPLVPPQSRLSRRSLAKADGKPHPHIQFATDEP